MSSKRRLLGMVCLAILATVLFSAWGCSKGNQGISKYYPAKLDSDDDWGLADLNGNMIVSKQWKNRPSMETEGIVFVANKDGEYEFYKVGKKPQKIGGKYYEASNFSEGLAAVVTGKDDDKYIQYIDREGKVKIELKKLDNKQIRSVSRFNEGLAWVMNEDGKYGYIDKTGKQVVKCKYDDADLFSEGLACVGKYDDEDSKYGFIDKNDKVVIDFKMGRSYSKFGGGYCWFTEEGEETDKWGTIDKKGKIAIAPTDDIQGASPFKDGLAVFGNGETYGVINTKGKEVIRPKYDGLVQLSTGILAINGEKVGVINAKGKETMPLTDEYDSLAPIGNNRYLILESKKYLIVDKKGTQKSKNQFDEFDLQGLLGMDSAASSVSFYPGFDLSDWGLEEDFGDYEEYGYDDADAVVE